MIPALLLILEATRKGPALRDKEDDAEGADAHEHTDPDYPSALALLAAQVEEGRDERAIWVEIGALATRRVAELSQQPETLLEVYAERRALDELEQAVRDRRGDLQMLAPMIGLQEAQQHFETWLAAERIDRPAKAHEIEDVYPPTRPGSYGTRVVTRLHSRTETGGLRILREETGPAMSRPERHKFNVRAGSRAVQDWLKRLGLA